MSWRANNESTSVALQRIEDEILSFEDRKRNLEREILDTEQIYLDTADEGVRKVREILLVSKRREHSDLNIEIERRVAQVSALRRENNRQLIFVLIILGLLLIAALFK